MLSLSHLSNLAIEPMLRCNSNRTISKSSITDRKIETHSKSLPSDQNFSNEDICKEVTRDAEPNRSHEVPLNSGECHCLPRRI